MYTSVSIYTYKHIYINMHVCVCTCICQQCPVSSEACQTCSLAGNSAPVCAAAALCDFVVPPSLTAGWRRAGIYCKAGEVAYPQFCWGRASSLVSHPSVLFIFPLLALESWKGIGMF